MTQVKMPEPVAKVYIGNPVRYEHIDAWDLDIGTHMLITTTQAEAYAKARVREALENAAGICDARAMKNEAAVSDDEPNEASSLRSAAWQMGVCAREIRAMIPKEAT